ncbi:MAG: gliding motility protein GldL [Prevotella sp.]|nr:gliding motility protein GldL [Prevotella sp.]
MTKYSKYNVIYRLQKWLDSVPGQTFMNYAYSWGASIVILGALFKLTHLPGANFWLFLGMGTEVFVFFISGFDRPFDKTEDGKDLPTHVQLDELAGTDNGNIIGNNEAEGGTGNVAAGIAGGMAGNVAGGMATGGPVIIGGAAQGTYHSGEAADSTPDTPATGTLTPGMAEGGAHGPIIIGSGTAAPNMPQIDGEEMEQATKGFVEQLRELTETLQQLAEYSQHLTRNSEEIENLNRTLTGITKIYELQLKGASQQMGTQDQIVMQTQRMAEQIQQLNDIYTRMIKAMTVTIPAAPTSPTTPASPTA